MREEPRLREMLRSAAGELRPPANLLVRAQERELRHRMRRQRQRGRVLVSVSTAAALALIGAVWLPLWRPGGSGTGTGTAPASTSLGRASGDGITVAEGPLAPGNWQECAPRVDSAWVPHRPGGWGESGCDGAYYALNPTYAADLPYPTAIWTFTIGAPWPSLRCTIRIHVPDVAQASGRASYRVFRNGTGQSQSTLVDDFWFDQSRHRGRWLQATGEFPLLAETKTIELTVSNYADPVEIAVDVAQMQCKNE